MKHTIKSVVLGLSLLLANVSPAHANDVHSLTNYAKFYEKRQNGELNSCMMTFSAIFIDDKVEERAFFAEGTIGYVFNENRTRFNPFTKIAVSERLDRNGQISANPIAIQSAYLIGENGLSTEEFEGVENNGAENPLAKLKAYNLTNLKGDDFPQVHSGLKLFVKFSISESGHVYKIPIDLTITGSSNGKDIRSMSEYEEFSKCMINMIDIVRDKLK